MKDTDSQKNKIIDKEYKNYTKNAVKPLIIDTDSKNTSKIALDIEHEVTVFIKNNKGEILNKSGQIHLSVTYQRSFWPGKPVYDTIDLGNHTLKNGVSKFNYTLPSLRFDCEYILGEPVVYKFEYIDNLTHKKYIYKEDHEVWYLEDLLIGTDIITDYYISGEAGKVITFKGSVYDEHNNPVKTGRIVIKINERTIKSDLYLNNSEKFSYDYKIPANFASKAYDLLYVYVGNMEYARSATLNTLDVLKTIKIVSGNVTAYAGKQMRLNGRVLSKNKPLTTGRVVVKLNGKTIKNNLTLNKRGEFKYNYRIPNFSAKKYNLTYVYVDDKSYDRSEINRYLTIKNQASKITADNITTSRRSTVTIRVKVTGTKTGIKAMSGNVGFKLNGKTVKVNDKPYIKKIKNGLAVFKYTLPSNLKSGKYKITVTYSGGRNLLANKVDTSILTVKN